MMAYRFTLELVVIMFAQRIVVEVQLHTQLSIRTSPHGAKGKSRPFEADIFAITAN